MQSPSNINLMPINSDDPKELRKKLNELIRRLDECYKLLRADVKINEDNISELAEE